MDPFDDIFKSNATGEGNSTIDDDFDALFGNITVASTSDIDSILCEDVSSTAVTTVSSLVASKMDDKQLTQSDVISSSSNTRGATSSSTSDWLFGFEDLGQDNTTLFSTSTTTDPIVGDSTDSYKAKDIGYSVLKQEDSHKSQDIVNFTSSSPAPSMSVSDNTSKDATTDTLFNFGETDSLVAPLFPQSNNVAIFASDLSEGTSDSQTKSMSTSQSQSTSYSQSSTIDDLFDNLFAPKTSSEKVQEQKIPSAQTPLISLSEKDRELLHPVSFKVRKV